MSVGRVGFAAGMVVTALAGCSKRAPETAQSGIGDKNERTSPAEVLTTHAATAPRPPAMQDLGIPPPPPPVGDPAKREAYFGETHVHTSWSFDAYVFGNTKTDPADAYRYAMGEMIQHPLGYPIKLTRPLDWIGVTDHSEYVGAMRLAHDPNSALSKMPIAEKLRVHTKAEGEKLFLWIAGSLADNKPIPELVDPKVTSSVWSEVVSTADRFYKPGKFTTFAAYEWTSTPDNRNLHRNVFFRDTKHVPEMPFSSIDSTHPEDLWMWMDEQRKKGNEVLAIAHNANLSDGIMFPTEVDSKGRPIDRAWSNARMRNESLQEMKQIKGQSETHPILSPNDEFANFEILEYLLGTTDGRPDRLFGSYIRDAYKNGLALEQARGFNPFKFGVVGGSDSHNTGSPYMQATFFGAHGLADGTAQGRLSGKTLGGLDPRLEGTAGLSGVWADENTREGIFDAMKRRETFATSGVRMKVRFFGGWSFDPQAMNRPDWVKRGYEHGVPMGSDLLPPPADAKGKAPSFVVWAVKDPESANLDRVQIVKGWTKSGQTFEKVFDVAWSGSRKVDPATGNLPPIGSTVDIANATYTNTVGATELKVTWTDPEFDPGLDAFYYVRALEIPTPRWTTIQAKALGVAPPDNVAVTVQERAWSSPIWFSPSPEARKTVAMGPTVQSLKAHGAATLDDVMLKKLVVGKKLKVKNTVTGEEVVVIYGESGRRIVTKVDGKTPPLRNIGDVLHGGAPGSPAKYEIRGGHIVTTLAGVPFDVTVFKMGDKYLAARQNEFGYANYALEAVLP